jgi:aminoglycoside phosphotransferase (APT) family kinase protein
MARPGWREQVSQSRWPDAVTSSQSRSEMNPHGTPVAMNAGTPPADVAIDAALVKTLLQAQHPDLADQRIEPLDSGWDNAMFRLGDKLCVRLPRREAAVALLANEQRWLPALAKRLPLRIPAPLRIGTAGAHYPWSWSVLPWLAGVPADQSRLRADQGAVLAQFLKALHVPAPIEAPRNPYRGVPLRLRARTTEERMARLEQNSVHFGSHVRSIWKRALEAPIDVDDTWIHGDLHARNVLIDDARLSAIIDWGDLCQGDCATDLAALWMWLPDAQSRAMAMTAYGGSTATWLRARGSAAFFGLLLLETGLADHPRHAAMGEMTLHNLSKNP